MWPVCRKVYWSSLVPEPMELMHVLFLYDLPLRNAVLSYLSLLCDSWQSQSWLRFSEVTSDSPPPGKQIPFALECSEVLWLHLRRSLCSVLHLMFSVHKVLSLVLFIFGINLSPIFHTPCLEQCRLTVWMDFVPLPVTYMHSYSHNNS